VRVPVPDLRPAISSASPRPALSQPDDPAPHRYRARPRKLTTDQESAIRALAATKSLRSLAADFGVSHETIRTVLRKAGTRTA
jgi:FixJ family two-component response regulator